MLRPTWRIVDAPRGKTLTVGGCIYHPGEDPVRRGRIEAMEALVVVERSGGRKIVLIGFGLGFLAAPLVSLADVPVVVWDSMPWVAEAERRERFMSVARKAQIARTTQEVLNELTNDTIVITHNTAADMHYWEISFCESRFAVMNKSTATAVSQRSTDFLRRLPRQGLVQEHYGVGRRRACVLCSPGPSLDVGRVKVLKEKGYPVICAAQCLRALNDGGVVPDVTVALDPQSIIYDKIKEASDPGWIYADAMVDPRIWDEYPDRCFAFTVPTAHCHASVWRNMGYDWMDDTCCTVSELMLQAANKLGFGAVITSGVDYCADKRTDQMKIECEEDRWTWSHYFAGSRSWMWMIEKYQMTWGRLEDCDMDKTPTQEPTVFSAPSMRTNEAIVNHALQTMLSQDPAKLQKQTMAPLPPNVREAFTPVNPVPVVVHKR
jgi:hypothetical protein